MIPVELSGVENIPRRGYYLKHEFNSVTVYSDFTAEKFVAEISIDNFFELLETTTFSKGVAHSNLLIFIEIDDKIKLVNKNSKEHKKAMKGYIHIDDVPLKKKITFLSYNDSYIGNYLGEGLDSDNKKTYFVELEDTIICSNKINRIIILNEDKEFTPDFTKDIFSYSYGFRNIEHSSLIQLHVEELKENNTHLFKILKNVINSGYKDIAFKSSKLHKLSSGDIFRINNDVYTFLGSIIYEEPGFWDRRYYMYFDSKGALYISYMSLTINVLDTEINRLQLSDIKSIIESEDYSVFNVSSEGKVEYTIPSKTIVSRIDTIRI